MFQLAVGANGGCLAETLDLTAGNAESRLGKMSPRTSPIALNADRSSTNVPA